MNTVAVTLPTCHQVTGKKKITIKSRRNTFVNILMKLRSVAIHPFSLEHANSGVNFWTESLKAAGIEDTSVWGWGGVRGWRAPP